MKLYKLYIKPGLVAQAYNPRYLKNEGRRIMSSRPAWAKVA
jgi:hypothetical protein